MKKLYIVQIAYCYDRHLTYLPYAAGCLAAAVMADDRLRDVYGRPEILFQRLPVAQTLERIVDPDVVSFTNYIWNSEYNRQLARAVKERYPGCVVVFGGHDVSSDGALLRQEPEVDISMYGEGEISFPLLLAALARGEEPDRVPGASFRRGDGVVTVPPAAGGDLSGFVSPYLTGVFDRILAENPGVEFHATLETNRGCPFSCAYCEWCFDKTLRQFPMEKVKAEIEWMAEKKIEYCFCADGNFGILPRDLEIARWVVAVRERSGGYPRMFKPTYAKNSNDTVFAAGRLLYEAGADKGITISYQTLCEEALRNIGRKNLDIATFHELSRRYSAIGIPTYSDVILGLPGETFDSFVKTLCGLIEMGQHNSVSYYRCQVYSNAELGREDYRKKYRIRTARVPIDNYHYTNDMGGVEEYFDVVISTYSMTREDWERMNLFAVCTEAFHHIGLLRFFALYLRVSMNVPYEVFYHQLFDFLLSAPDTVAGRCVAEIWETIRHLDRQWSFRRECYGNIGWRFDEGLFLECIRSRDAFYREMEPFLRSFGVPEEIFGQLMRYQKGIVRFPGENDVSLTLDYDFYGFFAGACTGRPVRLARRRNTIHVRTEKEIFTWEEYAREVVWYGKRRGAPLLTNSRDTLSQTFPGALPPDPLPPFLSASVMMGAVTETDSLRRTVYGIAAAVRDRRDIAELLIAYPPDRVTPACLETLEALRREDVGLKLVVFPQTTPGIGFYSDCIERATGSHCIPFQTDLGMDVQIIPALIEAAKADAGRICTTSRWLPACTWTGYGTVKRLVNRLAQIFLRVLFGGGLTDYTNPVQIIPTEILRSIRWEKNDFSRFMEMQLKPLRLGFRYREIPTNCYERTDGKSNNSIAELLNYLLTAIHIRLMKKEDVLLPEYRGR